jgi:hypothetical protein
VVVFCVCVCARGTVPYLLEQAETVKEGHHDVGEHEVHNMRVGSQHTQRFQSWRRFRIRWPSSSRVRERGTSLSDGRPSRLQRQGMNAHEPLDTLMTSYLGASSLATYSRMSKLSSANSTFGLGKR